MSPMCVRCCGGRGDAARGPIDQGMFLRIWFPGVSICLASYSQ